MKMIFTVICLLFHSQIVLAKPQLPENKILNFDSVSSSTSKRVVVLKRSMPDFAQRLQDLLNSSYTCVSAPQQTVKCHIFNFHDELPEKIYSKLMLKWENSVIQFGQIKKLVLISSAPALEHWEVKQEVVINQKKFEGYFVFIQSDGTMKLDFENGVHINISSDEGVYRFEQVSSFLGPIDYKLYFTKLFFN
jgi:hypothetical protein